MRLALTLALALTFVACTRDESREPKTPTAARMGRPFFSFDWKQSSELTIAKQDPLSGDAWTARVSTNRPGDAGSWAIASAPNGATLIDRRADGNFIQHLLDTLTTLSPVERAPEGTAESYGLNPPFFSLRWMAGGRGFEVRLGAEAGKSGYRYASAQGFPVSLSQGATLRMLAHLDSFDVLRQRRLATATADEIDEFELFRGNRRVLYAQRLGDDWADRKGRKLPAAGGILEGLLHLRIRRFEDDATATGPIAARLAKQARFRARLTRRAGEPVELRFEPREGKIWASESNRPGAAFELFAEFAASLAAWPHVAK